MNGTPAIMPSASGTSSRLLGEGASADASTIRKLVANALNHLLEAYSTGDSYRTTITALLDVMEEAALPNWDGHRAAAINMQSVQEALRFLSLIPTRFPPPYVSVDPDGEVAFEWQTAPFWVFSISLGPNQTITYAGLFGSNRVRGVEYFGNEIPAAVINGIRRALTNP